MQQEKVSFMVEDACDHLHWSITLYEGLSVAI